MKTTNGFPTPNYTQTPNDFFDMIADMEESELRVTLVMIRQTFGFHRDGFKMGIGKLAKAAGLSENGAKAGAKAAEARGTFRRVNPDAITEAEWELVVEGSTVEGSTSDPLGGQPVTPRGSTSDPQVGTKERERKGKKGDLTVSEPDTDCIQRVNQIPLSIGNAIYAGEPITEEMVQTENLRDIAPKMFERALGFSKPLPWWSNKEWARFSEWVCERYAESKTAFGEYNIWRNTPYTKGGMSNNRIRGFVNEFYDSWDMFKMAKKKTDETRPEYKTRRIERLER